MAWMIFKYVNGESPEKIYTLKDGFKTIQDAYWGIVKEEINLFKDNGIAEDDPILKDIQEDIILSEVIDEGCKVTIDGANYEYYILRNKELTPFAFMCKIKNEIHMENLDEE